MLRTAGSIPVGTANSKQKNCPKRAVFLLFFASFSVKTGVKNSYAPQVRLSGIFVRTRDPRSRFATIQTQIGQENYTLVFLLYHMHGNDKIFPNKPDWMNEVASTGNHRRFIYFAY